MTNMFYPERHHPVFMLQDALKTEGVFAEYHKDEITSNMWGLTINAKVFVWLIDNRWAHEAAHEDPAARELIANGALVCCAQKPDAERIGAKWLPLAVTPGYTTLEKPVKKIADCGFVGYVRDAGREQSLLDLAARFSTAFAQGAFGKEAVTTYWQSRLGINIPTRYGDVQAYDSANMRCFEILATGTPLVTPYEDYLLELGFVHGANSFFYRSPQDLLNVVHDALRNHDLEAIGNEGAKLASEQHTYTHRAKQVMTWLTA